MNRPPTVGFVLEQALGHVTHASNLRAVLEPDPRVDERWCPIPFEVSGLASHLPLYNSNWTVRSGLRARSALRDLRRSGPLDALFFHTQVPAVLCQNWLSSVPSVVSIDATPIQFDALGEFYDHRSGNSRVEHVKWLANRRCFQLARTIVAWSSWAKDGVVEGYGVPSGKVVVVPPGVQTRAWARPKDLPRDSDVVRILFVGADFDRKGGPALLEAFRRLVVRSDATPGSPRLELHLVTRKQIDAEAGVVVHGSMSPNDPALTELYHRCHIFCLPTRADTLGQVLCEAAAAGLPLVSTPVAGIPEIVREGTTGMLVPPDDVEALTGSLAQLIDDPDRRRKLGEQALRVAQAEFDAATNAGRLVEILLGIAGRP